MMPDETVTLLLRDGCHLAMQRLRFCAAFTDSALRRRVYVALYRIVFAVGLANEAVADLRRFLADMNSTTRWWWAHRADRMTRPRDSGRARAR